MIDCLEIADFLDPDACADLRAELSADVGAAATLLGGALRNNVRRTTRLAPPPSTSGLKARLITRKPDLERHFGVALTGCEEPQFLRYDLGDFFVPHQDGNTPLIHDESRFRKVSVVLFLSRQSDEPAPDAYGGGVLTLHGSWTRPELRIPIAPPPGTLVAFRAETTHEVTPVTHGRRYTVATWFR